MCSASRARVGATGVDGCSQRIIDPVMLKKSPCYDGPQSRCQSPGEALVADLSLLFQHTVDCTVGWYRVLFYELVACTCMILCQACSVQRVALALIMLR
jgi:hypothetical protein